MRQTDKKLIIIQNIVPSYRVPFFNFLRDKIGDRFVLIAGTDTFESSIKSDSSIVQNRVMNNHYLLGRKFIYHTGISDIIKTPYELVLELNPRNLTVWWFLIYRRLKGLKTTLWGHAWPRDGKQAASDALRHIMRSLATHIITYTVSQKKELEEKMPKASISASSNALMRQEEMSVTTDLNQISNIIYVGRLVHEKKPMLLLESFHRALDELPIEVQLVIIGSGPERRRISDYINENELSNRVILKEPIFENSLLRDFYSNSLVSASPGYVGLNLIQSLSYGVPMVISKNENHSPEIEAANEYNSVLFATDEVEALKKILIAIYNEKEKWVSRRESIMLSCKHEYSLERMGEPFIDLANV